MIISHSQANDYFFRDCMLGIQVLCLKMYKKTSNQEYIEYAKYFGNEGIKIKKRLAMTVNNF